MKEMSIKELALSLAVSQNTIRNWELVLGLNIKRNDLSYRVYNQVVYSIFIEVKELLGQGKSLKDIKSRLYRSIEAYNKVEEDVINKDSEYLDAEYESIQEPSCKSTELVKREDLAYIFHGFAEEMKKYVNSMLESSRKALYLEDNNRRKEDRILELEEEVKHLQAQLEQKEKDLQEACKPWYYKIF